MDTENDPEMKMIRAAQDVGMIAEMNCHATASLARFLERKGKCFCELTIRDLLSLVAEWRREREEVHGSAGLRSIDALQHCGNRSL